MSFLTPTQGTPGWFDDPQVPGVTRYWDGQGWTERSFGEPLPPPGSVPTPVFRPPRRPATIVDGYAIAALVTGILGVCAGIVPLYLGAKAKTRIRASGGARNGSGLATAGQVLGTLWLLYAAWSLYRGIELVRSDTTPAGP
ncbi:MAG: DUF4190 domain-containing protein [Acidimicrobiales bacterium]|nr:DUF4190 domain-containing protein [Acidimicrobiales bacterium]